MATGSRVLKSLVMLLAAGVDTEGFKIVPVIIDPHSGNRDLGRTEELLRAYQFIRKDLGENHCKDKNGKDVGGFFKAKIDSVDNEFFHKLDGIEANTFSRYINHASLDQENKDLINLLYSDQAMNTEMNIGFVGKPNIGVVVLNTFFNSNFFQNFGTMFGKGDRIFLIGSIFGGNRCSRCTYTPQRIT